MKNALKEIVQGFNSLVTGMRITIGQFFKPTITVHYPHQTLKIPERFRGHIELVRDPETGKAICYACGLCQRACPSDCITVEGVKLDGAKKKSVSHYVLDFTKCSLCGSCVEACRDSAIRFSRDYNIATLDKDQLVMDLFRKLEREAGRDPNAPLAASTAPASTPAPATPQPPAAASVKPTEPTPGPLKIEAPKIEVKLEPSKPVTVKEEAKCS